MKMECSQDLVEKKEVRLGRTISIKKDEYYLDGKPIIKSQAMNFLESAGFSRSNSYYVVKQGKIESLTVMEDAERLDLLKEIGGTRVYEERHREILKLMKETGHKRKQMIQLMQNLDGRLRELEAENTELEKYQQLDKERKSLEYNIFYKELDDARKELAEVEKEQNAISEELVRKYNASVEEEEEVRKLDRSYKDLTKEVQGLTREKQTIEEQQRVAVKTHTAVELDVKDLEEKIIESSKAKDEAGKQLEGLHIEIEESTAELNKTKALYDKHSKADADMTKEITKKEKQLRVLYQKEGHEPQFRSKAARDESLQKDIDKYNEVLSSNKNQENLLNDEISKLESKIAAKGKFVQNGEKEIKAIEDRISGYRKGYNKHKPKREELHDKRKSLWKKETEITAVIKQSEAEVSKAESALHNAIPGEIRSGIKCVKRICREHNIAGVYGLIIELLKCSEDLFTAGNSLLHVVVENDDISTQLIRHLNAEKGGRVAFIPLNRVKAPLVTYPNRDDAVPLLKKMIYSPEYHQAFAHVFGRTLLCNNVDVASKVAVTDGLDCITLEGIQVSKGGDMTGGFYDTRRSKLKFMEIIQQNASSITKNKSELEKVRSELIGIDKEISALVSEQQKDDAELAYKKSEVEQLKQEVAEAKEYSQTLSEYLEKKRKLLANVETQIEQIKNGINMKRDEMRTELVDHLTPEEKSLLSRLRLEIAQLNEQLVVNWSTRVESKTRKEELETNLSTNLVRRRQELEAVQQSQEADDFKDEVEAKKQELQDAKMAVEEVEKLLKEVSVSIDGRNRELMKINKKKADAKARLEEYEKAHDIEDKEADKLNRRRNILLAKREELARKIRGLGPLSSDAFGVHKRRSIKELGKMLYKCNEKLKQFSHVNKNALDQYANFTDKREEVWQRKQGLDAGDEIIEQLISAMDQLKEKSIEHTFKDVAKHFQQVFSELVQSGHGTLIMMKKKDDDPVDNDYDEDGPLPDTEGGVENYIGVKVKVSFTGQGDTLSMEQLSGGQKAVVALALIFSIQRCDPAPVYLFDEVDAALDPEYRTAVGNVVRRLADTEKTQYIASTFRPELVKVADKIYGVTHKNRVSHVDAVTMEGALGFIEHDPFHNAE